MLYKPIDFTKYTNNALLDSGALVSVLDREKINKNKKFCPISVKTGTPAPPFHIQVANGHFEKPLASARLVFEKGDSQFQGYFIFMEHLSAPIIGPSFYTRTTHLSTYARDQEIILFPHLTKEMKTEEEHITYKSQFVKIEQTLAIPPNTTTTITAHVNAAHQYQNTRMFTTTEYLKIHKIRFANSISTVSGKKYTPDFATQRTILNH